MKVLKVIGNAIGAILMFATLAALFYLLEDILKYGSG